MDSNQYFWNLVKKFNLLMKESITGPSCVNPDICHGDCCSIKIDISKVLAKEYIKRGYASKDDFPRSNTFSFRLRFDDSKGKCFLFDENINGCSVHQSGIKPPQCWIYPTNFSNASNKDIKCKKVGGWKIIDQERTQKAQKILGKIIFLCKLEARKELRSILERLGQDKSMNTSKNKKIVLNKIQKGAPKNFAGLKDGWDHFDVLRAEGLSLQLKKICKKNCEKKSTEEYLSCSGICERTAEDIFRIYANNIMKYINVFGADVEGEYPIHKIFTIMDQS